MTYDVAIVGASIGGCAAARLYGERGVNVALIEKRPDPQAYKTVCTHYIQSSATPVIHKLGLADDLDALGAIHNTLDVWTPYGGWIPWLEGDPEGYNVTRRILDPLLREKAASTPGVELRTGETVSAVHADGVELKGGERIRARLVVGADGRGSATAKLAGIKGRVKPHGRFFYWAYWRGLQPASTRSRSWFLDPDAAYSFPNEDGLTLVLVAPHKDRLPEFRADLERAYLDMVASLPDGPDLSGATRESKILGKLDLPNVLRPAAQGRVALVGDAALSTDPLWGVGCGFALQSADWLVEETAAALTGGSDEQIDAALERYRKVHFRRLAPHHAMIVDSANARPTNAFERMMFRAAVKDEVVAKAFGEVASRRSPPTALFRPRTLARMVRAGVPA